MTFKVFIDGRHGTTGLKIDERLSIRPEIAILTIPEAQRPAKLRRERDDAAAGERERGFHRC